MIIADVAVALSVVGVGQAVAGWGVVRRFAARRRGQSIRGVEEDLPPVTILKPLYGNEPLLEEALASVCRQDYPVWQVVFGVKASGDTALPVARRVQARFPGCDMAVVIDPTEHGPNRKVGNLINMLPAAKHNVLVIADSDVHAAPDWLRRLVATLRAPGVGLVTTVYVGLPAPPPRSSPAGPEGLGSGYRALPGVLGAMQINQFFLPGALLARAMGRQDCLGATMMLRRKTLDRIGGLPALVDHLADDNVLGRLVQGLGLEVALADTVPATTVPEATLPALWRHELRWARTIRTLVPAQFAASALQYPLVWAGLALVLAWGAAWVVAWFAAAWAIRALVARSIDRVLALAMDNGAGHAFHTPVWLLPLRELMSVVVMIASYAGRAVDWRGHTLQAEGFDPR